MAQVLQIWGQVQDSTPYSKANYYLCQLYPLHRRKRSMPKVVNKCQQMQLVKLSNSGDQIASNFDKDIMLATIS
jgi:hypothetical protein